MTDYNTSENIVLEPLSSEMRCGVLTNAKSEIMIIHDQETRSPVQYIEYDQSEHQFSIVYENGETQDLGLDISPKMQKNLIHGSEVTLAHVSDKKIQSEQRVVFFIRDY